MADSSAGPKRLTSSKRRRFNPMVLLAIADGAVRGGYAASSADAVRLVGRFLPEIVVLDFSDVLGAIDVARSVRQDTTSYVGIVALCRALTLEADRVARYAGCDVVLQRRR